MTPTTASHARRNTLVKGVALTLAATFIALAGCRHAAVRENRDHRRFIFRVPYSGVEITPAMTVGFDIENRNGSVTVVVDPQYKVTSVEARPRNTVVLLPRDRRRATKMRWATVEQEIVDDNRVVMRITADPLAEGQVETAVDIVVRTPVSHGVTIRTDNGRAHVIGGTGAIAIDSGFAGGKGGAITVRTTDPGVGPVFLRASRGDITYYTDQSLSAAFELTTADGTTTFFAPVGRPTNVEPGERSYRGQLNGGTEDVRMTTERGNVRFYVTSDPMQFSNPFVY